MQSLRITNLVLLDILQQELFNALLIHNTSFVFSEEFIELYKKY